MGKKKWRRYVARIVEEFHAALEAGYVVLGGGNVKKIKTLPAKTRLGTNGNAFVGGYRLWLEKQGTGTNAFAAQKISIDSAGHSIAENGKDESTNEPGAA